MNHIQANIAADTIVEHAVDYTLGHNKMTIRLDSGQRITFAFDVDMIDECIQLVACGIQFKSQSQIVDGLLDSEALEMTKRYFDF